MKKLVIIGASGHGKVLAEIAYLNKYQEIVFLDDNVETVSCGKYPVVGSSRDIYKYEDADFIVGIGNARARKLLIERIKEKGLKLVSLIHPNAILASDIIIGNGSVVMAGAVINVGSSIGEGCIINTCSSVDHDCSLDDYVHIAVGSHLAGSVVIGKGTWIGAGAIVSNNLTICDNCMVGAGAVVVRNIDISGTYVGVPAHLI